MAQEVATIVIDTGSQTCKAGFAGDERPKKAFRSIVGREKFHSVTGAEQTIFMGEAAHRKRGILNINYPVQKGIIKDWEDIERIWEHVFTEQLEVMSEDYSLLLTEVPNNPSQNREKTTLIVFESFDVPSFSFAVQPVLALYASGLQTGTVLDSGDGITNIVPVYEGSPISHGIRRLNVCGRDLTDYLLNLLLERGYTFVPNADHDIVQGIKEKVCFIAQDYEKTINSQPESDLGVTYELPDGRTIPMTNEWSRVPEVLFQPSFLGLEDPSLHDALYSSIMSCDNELQKILLNNIVLSGGNTLFEGMADRLLKEIKKLIPASLNFKAKILAPSEREYSVWMGGSILASLTTFKNMCITKQEYQEFGASLVRRKCI
ncbi:hypothetical protein G9A89_009194 [Geosiphon pyriformis]|nr:hypothetical protein G9A89_009194 [Geosiphon pyriformis]